MVCGSGCPVPEAHPTLSRFHTHNPAPKGTVKSGCVNITWGALARGGALPENVWSGDLQRSLYLFFRPLSGQPKPRAAADGKWKRGHKKEKSLCLFTSCKEHHKHSPGFKENASAARMFFSWWPLFLLTVF